MVNIKKFFITFIISTTLLVISSIIPVLAEDKVWDGGGASNLASDQFNWVADNPINPGDNITFTNINPSKPCTWDIPYTVRIGSFNIYSDYLANVDISTTITIDNNLTISGGNFNVLTTSVSILGDMKYNGGQFTANTSTIAFTHWTNHQYMYLLPGTTFYCISHIKKTGAKLYFNNNYLFLTNMRHSGYISGQGGDGRFNISGSTIYIRGDFSSWYGTFDESNTNSKVIIDGTDEQFIADSGGPASNVYNLEINKVNMSTFNAYNWGFSIQNDLTVKSGVYRWSSSGNPAIGGNITVYPGAMLNYANGTISLSDSGNDVVIDVPEETTLPGLYLSNKTVGIINIAKPSLSITGSCSFFGGGSAVFDIQNKLLKMHGLNNTNYGSFLVDGSTVVIPNNTGASQMYGTGQLTLDTFRIVNYPGGSGYIQGIPVRVKKTLTMDKGSYLYFTNGGARLTVEQDMNASGRFDVQLATVTIWRQMKFYDGGSLDLGNADNSTIRVAGSIIISTGAGVTANTTGDVIRSSTTGEYIMFVIAGGSVNVSGLTLEGLNDQGLVIENGSYIQKLSTVAFQNFQNSAIALQILQSGTTQYTFDNLYFDASISTNVSAPNLFYPGYIAMQFAAGPKSGPAFEYDPNNVIFWSSPTAVGSFNGLVLSTCAINWSWIDNSNEELGYRIKNSTGGLFGVLGANVTDYLEASLSPNTSYYRYAEAYNPIGTSSCTPVVKYTLANPATGTYAINATSWSLSVGWGTNNNSTYTQYRISVSSDNFQVDLTTTVWATGGFTTVENLFSDTTYWITVVSKNGNDIYTVATATPSIYLLDNIAPAPIDNLSVIDNSIPGQMTLWWSSKGDNGLNKTIPHGQFNIQHASYTANLTWSVTSAQITISTANVSFGEPQIWRVTNLLEKTTYYLRAWTQDKAGNWSELSNSATTYTADMTVHTWDGGGADNFASNNLNWVGDIVPSSGDSVIFGSINPTKYCDWDLPSNVAFSTFSIQDGYSSNVNINTNIIIDDLNISTGIFNINASSITVKGNLTYTAGMFSANTSTICFSNKSFYNQNINVLPGTTFYSLFIDNDVSNTRNVFLQDKRIQINGNLNFYYGWLNTNGSTISFRGDINNSGGNGVFANNGTWILDKNGNQTINNSSNTFSNLEINKVNQSTVTILSDINITGSLTVSNGVFRQTSNNTNVDGNITLINPGVLNVQNLCFINENNVSLNLPANYSIKSLYINKSLSTWAVSTVNDLEITGELLVTTGWFDFANKKVTLSNGNVSLDTNGDFTVYGSTFVFAGSSSAVNGIKTIVFDSVQVNKNTGQELVINQPVKANKYFQFNSGKIELNNKLTVIQYSNINSNFNVKTGTFNAVGPVNINDSGVLDMTNSNSGIVELGDGLTVYPGGLVKTDSLLDVITSTASTNYFNFDVNGGSVNITALSLDHSRGITVADGSFLQAFSSVTFTNCEYGKSALTLLQNGTSNYTFPNFSFDATVSSNVYVPNLVYPGYVAMPYSAGGHFGIAYEKDPNNVTFWIHDILAQAAGFMGTAKSAASIEWGWTDMADDEQLYKVFASTGGIIGTVQSNTTYFIESNLMPNTTYSRYVQTYNPLGTKDAPSNGQYTLANPPDLDAMIWNYIGFSSITFTWSKNSNPDGTPYEISFSSDNFVNDISTPIPFGLNFTGNTTTFNGLDGDTNYYFRGRAKNGVSIDSVFSVTTSTKTQKDLTPPTISISTPANNSYTKELNSTQGQAQDNVLVTQTEIKFVRVADGYEWNGSSFASGSNWYNVNQPYSAWDFNSSVISFESGFSYQAVARSKDSSSNYSTVYATANFVFDISTPIALVSYPANSASYKALTSITGTSIDNVRIQDVLLEIKDLVYPATYYNGSAWVDFSTWVYVSAQDGTFNSTNEIWTYDASGITWPEGHQIQLAVRAIDAANNNGDTSPVSSFYYDVTKPTATIAIPVNSQPYKGGQLASITGTFNDKSPGTVSTVNLKIRRSDGQFWTGSGWGAEIWLTTSTAGEPVNFSLAGSSWSYNFSDANKTTGSEYTIIAMAIDNAENDQTVFTAGTSSNTFIYDNEAPETFVTFPTGTYLNSLPTISGTVADITAGAYMVGVSTSLAKSGSVKMVIFDNTTNKYWNGVSWIVTVSTRDCIPDNPAQPNYTVWKSSENVDWQSDNENLIYVFGTDDIGNEEISSVKYTVYIDTQAPGQITTLEAYQSGTANTIKLSWMTPGDNGYSNTLASGSEYRIQYSTWTGVTWSTSVAVSLSTSAVTPGTRVTVSVALPLNAEYYFRVWTKDESNNWSVISSSPNAYNSPFTFETVDGAGQTLGQYVSQAIDKSNNIHAVYRNIAGSLFYNKRTGISWGGSVEIDPGMSKSYFSIAVDVNNNPHVSYVDDDNFDLKYAKYNGVAWSTYTIDSMDINGAQTSIAIDPKGNPNISYWHDYVGFQYLKFAKYDGVNWSTHTADSLHSCGTNSSLAIDAQGNAHISHYFSTDGDLKYASYDGLQWSTSTIDANGNVGQYTALAIGGSGDPHIAYWDSVNYDLKYARFTGSTWTVSTVDSSNVGGYISIALDGSENPVIAYYESSIGNLKFARFTGSQWDISTVDSLNDAGQYTSLSIDGNGDAHIVYLDVTNSDLKAAHWTGASLAAPMGGNARGKVQSPVNFIASAVNTSSITWQWTDNASNELGFRVYSATSVPYIMLADTNTISAVGGTGSNGSWVQTNITPNTSWQCYVTAVNAGGVVTSSGSSVVWTNAQQPVYSFSNVYVSSMAVYWSTGANPPYTEYYVECSSVSYGFQPATVNTGWVAGAGFWTVSNTLVPNTQYYFRIKARNLENTETGWVNLVSTATLCSVPGMPPSPASNITSQALRINWLTGTPANPGWSNYLAECSSISIGGPVVISSITKNNYADFAALSPNVTYYFQVKAVSVDNMSTVDTPLGSTHTLCNVPGLYGITDITTGTIMLNWTTNSNPAGTSYLAETSSESIGGPYNYSSAWQNTTYYMFTGLNINTTYWFRISAKNYDNVLTTYTFVWTGVTLCETPTSANWSLTTDVQHNINWNGDASGNPSSTIYIIQVATAANFSTISKEGETTRSVLGWGVGALTPNTTYYGRLIARNRAGVEAIYNIPNSSATVCQQPDNIVWGTAASNSMIVDFSADATANPADTIYTAVLSSSTDFSTIKTQEGTKASSTLNVTGLLINTTYYGKLIATNRMGTMVENTFDSGNGKATLCEAPNGLAWGSSGATSLRVNWTDTTGNPDNTVYIVTIGTSSDISTVVTSSSAFRSGGGNGSTLLVNNILPNTSYYAKVTAYNRASVGNSTDVGTLRVTDAMPPDITSYGTVTNNSIIVNWGTGESPANPDNTQYILQASTDESFSFLSSPEIVRLRSDLNVTIPSLNPNTTYFVRLIARNWAGSAVLSQLPQTWKATLCTAPDAASYGTISTGTIGLNWGTSEVPANPDNTIYLVQTATSTNFSTITKQYSGLRLDLAGTVTALTENTTYFIRLVARNREANEQYYSVAGQNWKATYTQQPAGSFTYLVINSDYISISQTDTSSNPDDTLYSIEASTAADFSTVTASTGTKASGTIVVTNLVPDTTYFMQVRAINREGIPSNTTNVASGNSAVSACETPDVANWSGVSAISIQINWTGDTTNNQDDTVYIGRISTSSDMSSYQEKTGIKSDNFVSFNGLTANTSYYGKLYARNHAGSEKSIDVYSGIPKPTLCSMPGGAGWGSNSSIDTLEIVWSDVANPPDTVFITEVSTSSDFSTNYSSITVNYLSTTTITGLTVNTTYYGRVTAVNREGQQSSPSDISTPKPTLANPATGSYLNNVTTFSIVVNWYKNGNPDYTRYGIIRSTDNFTTSNITVINESANWNTNSYTDSSLQIDTSYFYKICAYNESGIITAYDITVSTLTIPLAPDAPAGISAIATVNSIQWNWTKGTNADGHRVKSSGDDVNLSGDLAQNVTYWDQTGFTANISTSIYIESFNVMGSSASGSYSKYTLADMPNPISFGSIGTDNIQVDFGSDNNSAGTFYCVEVSTMVDYSWGIIYENVWTANVVHNTLNPDTSYYYRIRARNGDNVYSNYAANIDTATAVNVPGTLNVVSIGISSAGVSWGQSNQVWTEYEVFASTGDNLSYGLISSGIGAGPVTHNTLDPNTTYYYQVRAKNVRGGYSTFNSEVSTVTYCSQPASVTYGTVTSTTMQVSWGASTPDNPSDTTYQLKVSSTPDFITVYTSETVRSAGNAEITGLSPNTTYYVIVAAINRFHIKNSVQPSPDWKATNCNTPVNIIWSYQSLDSLDIDWWSDSSGNPADTTYIPQISTATDFTTIVISSQTTKETGAVTLDSLTANTTYYGRLIARNRELEDAVYTLPVTSVTYCAVPAGVTYGPGDTYLDINWSDTTNNPENTVYIAQISLANDFSSIDGSSFTNIQNGTANISPLIPNTTYYGRLIARNHAGKDEIYNLGVKVTNAELANNINWTGITPTSLQLDWSGDTATNPANTVYTAVVSTSSSMSAPYFTSSTVKGAGNAVVANLTPNTTYYGRIWAVNWENSTGVASPAPVANITYANQPLSTYIDNITSSTLRINWLKNSNPDYTRYGILRSVDNFTSTTTIKTFTDSLQVNNYIDTGLSSGNTYYYKVCAYNETGTPTIFDTTASSYTSNAPDYVAPTVGVTKPSLAFYSALASITGTADDNIEVSTVQVRIIRLSDNNEWNGSTFTAGPAWNGVTVFTNPTWTYNPVPAWVSDSSYTVIAKSQDSSTNWSDIYSTFTFTYDNTNTSVPSLLTPTDTSAVNLGNVSFDWSDSSDIAGIAEYELLVSTSADFGAISYSSVPAISAVTLLNMGSKGYFWKVRSKDSLSNYSAFSSTFSLLVDTVPPVNLTFDTNNIYVTSITVLQANLSANDELLGLAGTPYYLQLSTDNITWGNFNEGWTSSATFTTLTPNTTYWLRVKVKDSLSNETQYTSSIAKLTFAQPPVSSYLNAVTSTTITVNWSDNTNPGYTKFALERSTDNFATSVTLLNFASNWVTYSYADSLLLSDSSYYYRVSAYNETGAVTVPDVVVSTRTKMGSLDAPAGLTGTALSTNIIMWNWNTVSFADGYRIRSFTGDANLSGDLSASTTWWNQQGLSANISTNVYVESFNAEGSAPSGPQLKYALATVPGFAVFSSVGNNYIQADWTQNGNANGTDYVVECSSVSTAGPVFVSSDTKNIYAEFWNLDPNTTYYFQVMARNGNSIDSQYIDLTTKVTLCNTPNSTGYGTVLSNSIEIIWVASVPDNPADTPYVVQAATSSDFSTITSQQSRLRSDASGTLGSLNPNTTYYIRILAGNRVGLQTVGYAAQPWNATLPESPNGLNWGTVTQSSLIADWSSDATSNPADTRYVFEVSSQAAFSSIQGSSESVKSDTAQKQIINLTPNTTYYGRVTVISRTAASVSSGLPAYNMTLANFPSGSYVNNVTSYSITVNWSNNQNPSYTKYGILRSSDSVWATTVTVRDFSNGLTGTNYTDTGLTIYTTYYYKVCAYSENSQPTNFDSVISTLTILPAPLAPTLSGTPLSTNSIQWSWVPGTFAFGHRVRSDADNANLSGDLAASVTYWIMTGLSVNSSSNVYVQAYNPSGTANSTALTKYSMAEVPGSAAMVMVGLSSTTITWGDTNPAGTNYQVARATDTSFATTTLGTLTAGTTSTITTLTQGTTYYIKVRAQNTDSIFTNFNSTISIITDRVPNGPPTAVNLIYPVASTVVTTLNPYFNWTAATDPEADPVSYEVQYTTDSGFGGYSFVSGITGTTGYTLATPLMDNASYYWRIRSYATGGSTLSSTSTFMGAFTVDTVPNAPAAFNLLSPADGVINGTTTITLDWQDSSDADLGASLTYSIYYSTYITFANTMTVTGLVPSIYNFAFLSDNTYYWKVAAVDNSGLTTFSSQEIKFVIDTADKVSPAAITTLSANTGDSEGEILLSWNSTGDDDVSGIFNGAFRIAYATSASVGWAYTNAQITISTAGISSGTTMAYKLAGLYPDATYYFRIWAVDDYGNYSDISNAATTYARNLAPAAPASLQLTVQPEGGQLNLSWLTSSEPDIKAYKLYRSIASGNLASKSYIATILNPSVSYQDKSVANNTTYYYQLTAIDNTNYESSASSEVNGCPVMLFTAGSVHITFSEYNQYYSTITRFEASETWVGAVSVSTGYKEGSSALLLTSMNSAVVASTFNFVTGMTYSKLNDSDGLSLWINVDDQNNLSYIKLVFGYTADFANRIEYTINNLTTGWNKVNITRADGAKAGTFFWNNVVAVHIDAVSMPGKTASVIVDDLRMVSGVNTTGGIWQQNSGVWALEEGSAGNTVYSQQDTRAGNKVSLLTTRTYTDFTYYTKMKMVEGLDAGVVFRADGTQGYKFSNEGSTFTFTLKTLSGTQLSQGTYNISNGTWYYVKVYTSGTTKRVYMSADGVTYTLVCEETVSNDYTGGYVGLYANATYAQFDDVHIMFNPASLAVTASDKQAVLTWTMSNTVSFSKYFVYRSSVSADGTQNAYEKIRTVTVAGITDTDNLENGVTYYYKVTAVDTADYESGHIGPEKALPYEIIAPDTILGKVTQKDGTPLSTIPCEALLNDTVVKKVYTYTDGTYNFTGLTENTTYIIRVSLYEGEKVSLVYREVKTGTKSVNFTLEIDYELATISGQMAGYKATGKLSAMSAAKFSDYKFRAKALVPGNGIGYVEIYHLKDGPGTTLRIPIDNSGKYEIPNLLPGKYVVKGYNGVVYSTMKVLDVKEGQRVSITLSFQGILDGKTISYPNPSTIGSLTLKYYTGYNVPESQIKVYTIAGELVKTINDAEIDVIIETNANRKYVWNCRNDAGDLAASGVYLFILEVKDNANGEKARFIGKFAIIK
ncbi:MAG: hypothetical protein A2252_01250 [Elusimicrobia bacterium RIFOXYA2_FULL_39_19]|nr:MAG: hypothetical protein A2252_01250 [Elusimicrobia bacterium RIFOXYA2_FULL_39_19]